MACSNKIDVCYAYLDVADSATISATSLRGFLGHLFIEDTEFHHHSDNPYHYPLVQYKKSARQAPGDGPQRLCRSGTSQNVHTRPYNHACREDRRPERRDGGRSFAVEETKARFRFATPWIALNEENHRKFAGIERADRKAFLEKILVGNMLSALKGLSVFAEFKVTADLKDFRLRPAYVHENRFLAFHASFATNLALPRFFGLGKSVSKGYGAVEPL